MTSQSESVSKANARNERVPPLGGKAGVLASPGGVGGKKNKKILRAKRADKDGAKRLRWFACLRCGKYVLSFKKCRGRHNLICPPYNDPVDLLGSLIGMNPVDQNRN